MNTPILSILVLISNRPTTVKKCLDSLLPILEKVPSELILTDTGCGEVVRKIIEDYDATILDFEWCKDFSKARNVGLNAAKGEWFLFVDDDEWFEDTTEIIDFFNTGEYKKYGFASYIQRNYYDWDGKNYFDFSAGRIFKKHDGIQFIYSIHEQPNIVIGKKKYFNCFVHHYGYVYKNEEERRAHSKRNIELLSKENERNPLNVRMALHYAATLRDEEYSKALNVCKKIVDEFRDTTEEPETYKLVPLMIEMYHKLGKKDDAKNVAAWILDKNINSLIRADVNGILARLYFDEEDDEKTLECVKNYYSLYKNRYIDYYRNYQTPLSATVFEKRNFCMIIQSGIKAALKIEDEVDIKKWFDELSSDDFGIKSDFYHVSMVKQLTESFLSDNEHIADSSRYILNILDDNRKMDMVVSEAVFSVADTVEKLASYASLNGKNIAYILAKIALGMIDNKKTEFKLDEDEFKDFWNNISSLYPKLKKYKIWDYILDNIEIIKNYSANLTYLEWDKSVKALFAVVDKEDSVAISNFLIDIAGDNDERIVSIVYAYNKKQIQDISYYEKLMKYERLDIINSYAEAIENRIYNTYSQRIIDDFENYLGDEEKFALKVMKVRNYLANSEFESALAIAKDMIEKDILYLDCVKDIVQWINELSIESGFSEEMKELAGQIKVKIRELNINGEIEAARESERILDEFYKQSSDVS